MGVFTVGRQVALEIDMPGWWLANAAVDMDFRRGLYYDSSTANPRAATDFLSCTRASVGYATTSTGTLTSFGVNTLRITDLGLLVEDARTNYFLNSEDAGSWTTQVSGATVTANTTVAPDGNTTGDTIAFATGDYRYNGPLTPSPGTYTFSIWLKGTPGDQIGLRLSNITANVFTIVTLTSTWTRYSISGSTTNPSAEAGLDNRSGIITGLPNAAVTLQAWGGQVEFGAFPSSYIPTTGVAVARAAENITTSSSLQTAINVATGSLVAQVDNGLVASVAANIVDSNGTNLLGFDASNHALASMIGALATANTANRTTQDKLGLAWNASGRSLVLNGGTVANDASAQTPSATQHIGSTGTTNFIYAYVERLSAFTTKLADATLQGFTV